MSVFVYPMLVSDTINQNILPGVAKAMERYILVHRLDDIMRIVRKKAWVDRAGRVVIKDDLIMDSEFGVIYESDVFTEATKTGKEVVKDKEKQDAAERKAKIEKFEKEQKKRKEALDKEVKDRKDDITTADSGVKSVASTYSDIKDKDGKVIGPDKEGQTNSQVYDNHIKKVEAARQAAMKKREDAFKDYQDTKKRQHDQEKADAERFYANQDEESRRKWQDEQRDKDNAFKKDQDSERKSFDAWKMSKEQNFRKQERDIQAKRDRAKDREKAGPAEVGIGKIESSTITVEPTWVKVDTPKGPTLIGIKVVPYPVKSDGKLAEILLRDQKLKGLEKTIEGMKRKLNRWLLKQLYDRLKGIFGIWKRNTVTGDPKKDIIHDRSSFRTGVFAMVDMADLDDGFFDSAGGIKKLFGLGWHTLLVADDINKRVYFIPPEFKGTYSMIPYSFIYSGLNRDIGQAFEGIEDVRQKSQPVFRKRGNAKKILGEGLAQRKLDQFKGKKRVIEYETDVIFQEMGFTGLQESAVADKLKNITIKKASAMISDIKNAAEKKDHSKINKTLSFIPSGKNLELAKIESYCKKSMGSEFDKQYKFCQVVLQNSLTGHPENLIKPLACLIAFTGKVSRDPNKIVRENLRKSITLIRKKEKKSTTDVELVMMYILASSVVLGGSITAASVSLAITSFLNVTPFWTVFIVGVMIVWFLGVMWKKIMSDTDPGKL